LYCHQLNPTLENRKYIDYPSQVLAKAVKPAAILLTSVAFGRRFPAYRYFAVASMVVGVLLFMKDKVTGKIANSL
jgi:hypothetical protein